MHAMCLIFCLLRIWSLPMAPSIHHLNYLWGVSPWSVTSDLLDAPALLRSGQSQWMANLRIIVKGLRDELGEHTLDFPPLRKVFSFMSPLQGRLSSLGMSFVMKPLHPHVAETWRPFHDALALRPTASFIPVSYTVLEHTGDLLSQFEEGNAYSDGSLENLKCRIVVRGDLQETAMEDSWSPTVPFGPLKCF
jgi:hypothetical protein